MALPENTHSNRPRLRARIRATLIGAGILISAAACGPDGTASIADPESPHLSKVPACSGVPTGTSSLQIMPSTALTIGVGVTLDYNVVNQAGVTVPDCALKWTTSNSRIATIGSSGVAAGKAIGGPISVRAETATRPVLSTSVLLSVGPNVASVAVSPASVSLTLGASTKLSVQVLDATGNTLANRIVSWSSSNPLMASVATDGTVTALATGTLTITATSEGKSASSTIQVTNPLASSGWIYWTTSRHYYKYFPGSMTWDQARLQAASIAVSGFSAQLASLATPGEQAFVVDYLNTLTSWSSAQPYIWFGLFQNTNSLFYTEPAGGWQWLSGESFDGSTIWGGGEPNNATILGPEHCAPLSWYLGSPQTKTNLFVDFPCDQAYYSIGYVVELTPIP